MRILHIGDLHFRNGSRVEQTRILQSFCSLIQTLPKVDFIFFSGDLINIGANHKDFQDAHDMLFKPLLENNGLSSDSLFICAGNHDIDRTFVVDSLISIFSEKKSLDRKFLESWYHTKKADRDVSLRPSQGFFDYISANYNYPMSDHVSILDSVHVRIVSEKKIGIVTLNSSWFCSSERDDKGQLLIMPKLLEDAIAKISDCELKILMQHHPLNYLKPVISYDIEDLVHGEFNVLLLGHVHKEYIETQYRCKNGIYCNTTKATLCNDSDEIGFSILNFDFADLTEIRVERYHYIRSENDFAPLETVISTIPLGEEKHKQNQLRKKITSKIEYELREANKLLLNYDEQNERMFLDSFTDPIISKTSDEQVSINEQSHRVPYTTLLRFETNYLIFGKDKCGKTSLLKKLMIDALQNYSNESLIPLFLDYKELEVKENVFDVPKLLSMYYGISKNLALDFIAKGRLLLLLDNLNTTSSLHTEIIDFLHNNAKVGFIICSEYLTSRIFGEELDDLSYEKVFFKNITRNEIRFYTKKIPSVKEENHDIIVEKVSNFCKQLHLPLNYWTVSMILMIYKNSNDDYSKNLFSVLDSCVDEILQKKRFLYEKTNLKFEQYKSLCGDLASSLLKKYKETEYSCPYSELIDLVHEYKKKNVRIVTDARVIVDFLLECGILKTKIDNNITFRLNGIFEYFLAYHIKENPEFKNEVLAYPAIYLSFKNELEIYSGFNRSDITFLRQIFSSTRLALATFTSQYNSDLDTSLMNKIDDAYGFDKAIKKLIVKGPISGEGKDRIMDHVDELDVNSDVHLKKDLEIKELDVEIVEKYVTILARVLKNSDGVEDAALVYEIFDYLLDCYCQFGFYIVDEYKKTAKEENIKLRNDYEMDDDEIIGEAILKILSRILPVLVQAMMYDGLGHLNFTQIIEERVKKYRENVEKNQYKLFVLYFLLMDIDLNGNKALINDVFAEITLPPLKVGTLFKLNFYMAFKVAKSSPLEQFIKNRIQDAQLRIDGKTDINAMQQGLAHKSKRNLLKRKY